MPFRAMGYLASAVALAEAHLPKAEIEIVHTLHTAQRVNGVDIVDARRQARQFAEMTSRVLDGRAVARHLVDPVEPIDIDLHAIAEAIHRTPTSAREKLLRASSERGDLFQYVAAHILLHDTAVALPPLRTADAGPIMPKRIISIGAQSERPFYLTRMTFRETGSPIPGQVAETAQLFTKHVLPPYYMCREGEPHINQLGFAEQGYFQPVAEHPNPSVARDLAYLQQFLQAHSERTHHE